MAHLSAINYYIYSTTNNNDQWLLELELLIRFNHPKILVTYHNKSLYYFTLGGSLPILDFIAEYPTLQLKHESSIVIETVANTQAKPATDEYTPFASFSFLKAFKKMVHYNLSSQGIIKIFGNYSIIQGELDRYSVLYIEPCLHPNGDLLLSIMLKNQLTFFDTKTLEPTSLFGPTESGYGPSDFVLYLIPSGIRCHLFDPSSLKRNLLTRKHNQNENLLNLIKLSTGIDYAEKTDEMTWVKLIPNLKHLNNQTSSISKFVHSVDNKKFILWPWKLCLIQLGKYERTSETEESTSINPIDLISTFLDLSISNKQSVPPFEYGPASAVSVQELKPSVEMIDIGTPIYNTDFIIPDPMEIDDLFGDDSDELEEPEQEEQKEVTEEVADESIQEIVVDAPIEDPVEVFDFNVPVIPAKIAYIDIPKDMMLKKLNTPDYNDPGAPLPMMPTPLFVPQSVPNQPTFPEYFNSVGSSVGSEATLPKSIFSPIIFNPIIKTDIDTKYGKGGKFYVDKDQEIEKKRRNIRATSVSGYELAIKDVFRDEILSTQIDESSSEESDADEEMEVDSPKREEWFAPGIVGEASISSGSTNYTVNNTVPEKQTPIPLPVGLPNQFSRLTKSVSPFFSDVSPIDYDNQTPASHPWSTPGLRPMSTIAPVTSPIEDLAKTVSESTNYLPLILRSINVITIPNVFLLNNLISSALLPNFNVDEDENDLELVKRNEMIVRSGHLDEFLSFLGPNLIFDLGLNKSRSRMSYYSSEVSGAQGGIIQGLALKGETIKNHPIDYILPSQEFETKFFDIFPNSYKVNLLELLTDQENEAENHLSFLDDIDDLHPKAQFKRLKALEWDCMTSTETNTSTFTKYKALSDQFIAASTVTEDQFFKLPVVKARLLKNDNIVNLNHLAINFWKYLNFAPIKDPKNFQVLLIGEQNNSSDDFLSQIICNYRECNLGHITRVSLATVETRPDLESISNGLLMVNNNESYNDVYAQIDKKLNSLVELIKLDLINKTNNFEFDRPLLLLFINTNESFNSLLQISKIFRNFNVALTNHQLPLVNIFTKIIPSTFLTKQHGSDSKLKYLSNFKLSKLSMNLYNQCPNDLLNLISKNIYTQLVKEPPSKILFKFMNSNLKDNNFNGDLFLHLAYERLIDKNWCSAAWSDPLGTVTHTKSWYSGGSTSNANAYDMSSICDNIWNISSDLFKTLNEEQGKGGVMGGKKFLVLARVNNILLDDELVHWKRLSLKHRDISMIVLTVNDLPQFLFSDTLPKSKIRKATSTNSTFSAPAQTDNFFRNFHSNNSSPNAQSNGLITSPSGGISFHSPQQFLNAPGNFLSPQDVTPSVGSVGSTGVAGVTSNGTAVVNDASDAILTDPSSNLIGIVPKLPLSLFNHSTRLGMKTGYLLKGLGVESDHQLQQSKGDYLVLDINLLSCLSYWDLDTLMRLILAHYKKLAVLNDILGLRDIYGIVGDDCEAELEHEITRIVPWHILAVSKSLGYLAHVLVEE